MKPARLIRVKSPKEATPLDTEPTGLRGWYERALRRHQSLVYAVTMLAIYFIISILLGLSAAPGVAIGHWLIEFAKQAPTMFSYFLYGFALFLGFIIFGFSSLFFIPLANRVILPHLKPYRGPYHSTKVFPWFAHNILTYCVRYTFLDWITPTPFNLFFYRRMGMRIGDKTEVNTSNISDPGLIQIEDEVTIGGSVTLIAHYAVRGYLITAPVRIKKGATIGIRAIIMADTEVGEGAKILPNSVLLPKSRVPPGEVWGGIPAKKVDLNSEHER